MATQVSPGVATRSQLALLLTYGFVELCLIGVAPEQPTHFAAANMRR